MQECLRAQEAERRRLSHELHDELGQSLAVIQMSASFLEDRLKGAAPTMGKAAKDIMEAAGGALDVVRTTARRLRPAALDYLSLADTFRETLATWCSYKPKVASSFDTTGDIESLPEEFRVILFRILQESLTNIAKHADATSVAVRLDATGNGVTLTVEDNGKGMDVEESSAGFGLLSIKERTHALNGDFQIESESGHGTRLSVRLPISRGR
jgi:signal transduction histidine kinase